MNKLDFLQGFLRSPLEVGSILPSSRYMVRQVMKKIEAQNPKSLVEFGAGTGVYTRELYRYAQENDGNLLVFEKDDTLREKLMNELPQLSSYSDALDLPHILSENDLTKVDCILCGLPFTLFSASKTDQIFKMVDEHLHPNGLFIMYQYSTHMKKRLKKMFPIVDTHLILMNIPPTFVYYCRKK